MKINLKIPGFYVYTYLSDKYYLYFYKQDKNRYYYYILYYKIKNKTGYYKQEDVVRFWIQENRLREITDEEKLELL